MIDGVNLQAARLPIQIAVYRTQYSRGDDMSTTSIKRRFTGIGVALAVSVLSILQADAAESARPLDPAAPDVVAARKLVPDDLRNKGVLVAAMPLDYEPYNFLNDRNEQVGLDVDLLRSIAEVLDLKSEIQRMGFASVIPSVTGGRVDVGMSAMSILKPRLKVVSFVRYGRSNQGLIVRRGNPTGVRTTAACGHSIALEKGTQPLLYWQEYATKCEAEGSPKPTLLIFDGKGPQMLAVESGRAEAAGVGYATATIAAKHSDGKLEAAPGGPAPGGSVESGIAFAKDRPQLGNAIDTAIKVLIKSGTYQQIFERWGLADLTAPPAIVAEE
jgi:polar amino acid transport system substrate-binding protein